MRQGVITESNGFVGAAMASPELSRMTADRRSCGSTSKAASTSRRAETESATALITRAAGVSVISGIITGAQEYLPVMKGYNRPTATTSVLCQHLTLGAVEEVQGVGALGHRGYHRYRMRIAGSY